MTRKNWILIGAVLGASLLLVAVGLGLLFSSEGIPERGVLTLELSDELVEKTSPNILDRFFGGRQPTVLDVVTALDAAGHDERVPAVFLRVSGHPYRGLARAQEVRQAVHRYREAGGRVAVMLESGWLPEYYVASAADEVYLLPGGHLDLTGLVMVVPFLRGTLDTIGITPQFETSGEHKDTPEVYTEREMSPAMRENLERILDDLHGGLLGVLAEERSLSPEAVQALLDRGTLTASAALEAGLVDGIAHADEVRDRLEEMTGGALERLTLFDYLDSLEPGWFARDEHVALVYATGVIVHGESVDSEWYGQVVGTDSLSRTLRQVREDDEVKAVILRIDSPGGSASASEVIWREVRRTREEKPVIVSIGDYAASGGFYIAMGGGPVIAQPMSITGSIGVFSGKFALQGLYEWLGLSWGVVKRAENADLFLDFEPWTDEQRVIIHDQLVEIHARFREVVGENRGMEADVLSGLTTGRAWTGAEALRLSLVDRIGGLREAIDLARESGGLPAGLPVRVEVYPRPGGWLSSIAGGRAMAPMASPPQSPLGEALREAAIWEMLARERMAAYWPARVAVR